MKKIFLSLLSLFIGLNVMAQTTVYAAIGSSNNNLDEGKGVIYSFDISNPQTISEVVFSDSEFSYNIKHGVLAEDIYFAVAENYSDLGTALISLNCTTGVKTVVGPFIYDYDLTTGRANVLGMTYDNSAKKLYVIADIATYNEEEDKSEQFKAIFECNINNGKLTEVSRFYDSNDSLKKTNYEFLSTFASDHNGNLYAISIKYSGGYIKKLYKIAVTTGNVTEVGDFGSNMKTGLNESVSLVMQDNGSLLYLCGTGEYALAEINPTDCGITYKTNALKKTKYLSTGLCFAKSSADPEVIPYIPDEKPNTDETYKVKVVEKYGDILGTDPEGCTYKTFSYYDADNKIVREASYGKLLDENGAPVADDKATYQLERYKQYNYDENGNLLEYWTEQYGVFDGEDLSFKESTDRTVFYYDENGNVIKEDHIGEVYVMEYAYDENGNKTREARLQLDAYDRDGDGDKTDHYELWALTYSDFVNGLPTKGVCDGEFSNYKYNVVYTYDENGRLIEEVQSNYSDKNTNRYVWTYDGDLLVKHQTFKWKTVTSTDEDGNPVKNEEWFETNYTEYIPEAENPNRVKRLDWTWDEWLPTPAWTTGPVYTVTESSEFDGMFAPEVTINNVEDAINTAKLTITPPSIAATQQVAFDVYRKGLKLGRIMSTDMDAYDSETGTYSYIDADVPNGEYDYWVQTILFDELGEGEESKNVATINTHVFNVKLPTVTVFDVVEVIPYTTTVTDNEGVTTTYSGNYGRIKWDAPADEATMEKLGFVRYNVYQARMKAADNNEADGQATTWDFDFYENDSYDIYIQTVYKYGKANSETKTLTIEIEPIETTYQFASASSDWSMQDFTKVEDNKYEILLDEFTGDFKVYVDRDLFNCYTMGSYNPDIDENPFKIDAENLLVGPDTTYPAITIDEEYEDVKFTLTVEEGKLYLKMTGKCTGIESINAENGLYNVYNYQGIRILNNAEKSEVESLPSGFYIVNGQKVVIK